MDEGFPNRDTIVERWREWFDLGEEPGMSDCNPLGAMGTRRREPGGVIFGVEGLGHRVP
jgi:hypothetical protein